MKDEKVKRRGRIRKKEMSGIKRGKRIRGQKKKERNKKGKKKRGRRER